MADSVDGVLLLYHHPRGPSAPTIMEHVESFGRHSRYPVYALNTELGFPPGLADLRFQAVILHWSLFGSRKYMLWPEFLAYLEATRGSYRIAFFQDEYHYCRQRFAFIDEHAIDCVYTLLRPEYWPEVYRKHTRVARIEHTLTGYVSDAMIRLGDALAKPRARRRVDVGYRARALPYHMGRGGQEKAAIAWGFEPRARELGLSVDIETAEASRIYGHRWYEFVADCRAMLGAESGVSLFDLEDVVEPACARYLAERPDASFEEVFEAILAPWDEKIPNRVLSPRHFEAAAFRTCQVMFEGHYDGVLQPMRHYIPLNKDFSNLDEVIRLMRDDAFCTEMVETAHRELIASGRYSYRAFVAGVDAVLADAGLAPAKTRKPRRAVARRLWAGQLQVMMPTYSWEFLARHRFPGRKQLMRLIRPVLREVPAFKEA